MLTYKTKSGWRYFVDAYGDMFSIFLVANNRLYPPFEKEFTLLYQDRETAESVLTESAARYGWELDDPININEIKWTAI